jgi:hypothetical protein
MFHHRAVTLLLADRSTFHVHGMAAGSDIHRLQGSFPNLGRYQKVRIITLSGFDLGIASLNLKDR